MLVHTSTRVILDQELFERHPSTSDPDHNGGSQDTDEPELLGVTELRWYDGYTLIRLFDGFLW